MKPFFPLVYLMAFTTLVVRASDADIQGNWLFKDSPNIIGEKTDHLVTVKDNKGTKTITFTAIRYYARKTPDKSVRGPLTVQVSGDLLTFQDGGVDCKYTFVTDGHTFILPALVKVNEKSWNYIAQDINHPPDTSSFACETEFTKIPFGQADFPGVRINGNEGPQFYIYETYEGGGWDSKTKAYANCVRFLSREPDNSMREQCRITWGGGIGFGFGFVGSGWFHINQMRYERITDEDAKRLDAVSVAPDNADIQ